MEWILSDNLILKILMIANGFWYEFGSIKLWISQVLKYFFLVQFFVFFRSVRIWVCQDLDHSGFGSIKIRICQDLDLSGFGSLRIRISKFGY